jgi:hypothetical protein
MAYPDQLQIFDVSSSTNPIAKGFVNIGPLGFALAVQNNYAYVVNPGYGFQVIDISNINSPTIATSVPLGYPVTEGIAVLGNYAYVGAGNELYVFDITTPTSPNLVGSIALNSGVQTRSLAVENFSGTVYVFIVGGVWSNNTMYVYKISGTTPSLVGQAGLPMVLPILLAYRATTLMWSTKPMVPCKHLTLALQRIQ